MRIDAANVETRKTKWKKNKEMALHGIGTIKSLTKPIKVLSKFCCFFVSWQSANYKGVTKLYGEDLLAVDLISHKWSLIVN